MKFATAAAIGVVGATLMAAPLAPAQAHGFCGPFLPLCVAGAVVGAAATVATLPLAVASAPYGYAPPPAYYPAYPAAPAYYAPNYYPPAYYPSAYYAPGYYGYGYGYGYPGVAVGAGPYYRGRFVGRPGWRRRHF